MKRTLPWLFIIIVLAISAPAFKGSGRDLDYAHNLLQFLNSFFPPDFSIWREVLSGLWETIQISVLATAIATLIALPISIASSQKLSPLYLRAMMMALLSFIRAIPSLIWALLSVAVVGPYPLAGVIALVFYSLGYLGKFFADALDAQDYQVPQYLMRSGAHPIQAFQYGLWPNIKKLFKHHILWMLEYNIRSGSIIGYVGAGGLGTYLHIYQEYGRWDRFAFVILLIFFISLFFEIIGRKSK